MLTKQKSPRPERNAVGYFLKIVILAAIYCSVAMVMSVQNRQPAPSNLLMTSGENVTLTTPTSSSVVLNDSHVVANTGSLRPRLWILVSDWGEGMAGWIRSLSEVLLLAKSLNATLVEPCARNGRLKSCSVTSSLPVSEIFNIPHLFEGTNNQVPLMAPYSVFEQETAARDLPRFAFCMCLHSLQRCLKRCADQGVPNRIHRREIPEIVQAVNEVETSRKDVILEITNMWRNSLENFLLRNQAVMTRMELIEFRQSHFERFHPRHYEYVDSLLRRANLTRFSVIHWRAEKPNIDYIECAQDVLKSREIMDARRDRGTHQHEWILASTLSTNVDLMWSGSKKQALMNARSPPEAALDLLINQKDFRKIDNLVPISEMEDSTLLPVWDLILATRADQYATCTRECAKDSGCGTCNHRGKFGDLAISMRLTAGKVSEKCWPI